jgi:hypothetical protein
MAGPFYVSSVSGNNTTGLGWATAFTTMGACISGGLTAGDTVYVASDHHDSLGGVTTTFTFPGTIASPNKIYSCDRAAEPPTTLAAGGKISTTGAFNILLNGSFYMYGMVLEAGTTAVNATLGLLAAGAGTQVYDSCAPKVLASGSGAIISIGNTTAGLNQSVRLINTPMHFSAVGQRIQIANVDFVWQNVSPAFAAGSTKPTTTIFSTGSSNRTATITFDGLDLSDLAAATQIVPAMYMNTQVNMTNCKLAGSFSALAAAPAGPGSIVYAVNCSDTTQNYRQQIAAYSGGLTADTTTYLTAGASDGTTSISWKMLSNANTTRQSPLRSFEIARWNEVLTAQTVAVEIATDNVTLTNAECWIEVQVMDDAASTRTTLFSTQCGLLATPANIATSTNPWTGVPGTPITQKITSGSFTADIKGDIRVVVCLAKANTTVYVDPEITVA